MKPAQKTFLISFSLFSFFYGCSKIDIPGSSVTQSSSVTQNNSVAIAVTNVTAADNSSYYTAASFTGAAYSTSGAKLNIIYGETANVTFTFTPGANNFVLSIDLSSLPTGWNDVPISTNSMSQYGTTYACDFTSGIQNCSFTLAFNSITGSANNGSSFTLNYSAVGSYNSFSPSNTIFTHNIVTEYAYGNDTANLDIAVFAFNEATGALSQNSSYGTLKTAATNTGIYAFSTSGTPYNIAFLPSLQYAYVTIWETNSVSIFSLSNSGQNLSLVGTASGGSGVYRILVHPSGQFAYVANYTDNTISMFSVSNGRFTPLSTPTIPASTGTTTQINQPYYMQFAPSGNFLYVTNQANNAISAYSLNTTTGLLTFLGYATPSSATSLATVPGAGSNHLISLTPAGTYLYADDINNDVIQEYSVNTSTGVLTPLGTIATGSRPGGVSVDIQGKYVYATNSSGLSISEYSINPNGTLTNIGTISSPIIASSPRDSTLSPSGKYLLVPLSNYIDVFSLASSSGNLTYLNATFSGPLSQLIFLPNPLPASQY